MRSCGLESGSRIKLDAHCTISSVTSMQKMSKIIICVLNIGDGSRLSSGQHILLQLRAIIKIFDSYIEATMTFRIVCI